MPFSLVLRIVPVAAALLVPVLLVPALRGAAAGPASGPAPAVMPALGSYLAATVAGYLGDNGIAANLLLDAVAHDPGEHELLQPAFLFSTLAGRPEAAALATRVTPSLITALVLANADAARGDWRSAVRALDDLPGSNLNQAIRPLLLAWAQQGAGDTDAALRTLASAGSGGPLASACALEAGLIAETAGRDAAAAGLYRNAISLFSDSSLATVQEAGGFLVRSGHADEAQAMVQTLVQHIALLGMVQPALFDSLRRPVVRDPRQGLARAYLVIAALLQDPNNGGGGKGAKEAAGFMLRFALDLQPDLAPARLMMAELLAPEHAETAIAVLAGIPRDDPLAPLGELRSATLSAVTGRRDDGIARLQALVRAYPDRPEPAQALGDVLSDAKRYADAVAAFDHAIDDRRRQGGTGGRLSADDWQLLFARAVAFDRQDRWPQAKADLQQALALSPEEPFVLNYLGYSLVERQQDLSQARSLIQRALDGRPDDGSIRDSLGWAMLRQNDVPGAIRTLEQAAEQIPEDPTVNYHLGSAYWAAGRKIEAEDQWRWALVLHPEPDDAARIHDALRQAGVSAAP